MKPKTKLQILIFFVATAPLLFSQELSPKPNPGLPSEIVGPQLIAWSQPQKPQPVSPPLERTAQQPEHSANAQAQEASRQAPAAQILTGTILKDGNRYVLRVSGSSTSDSNTYELDDQERAKEYEGKQVKIAGALDAKGNSMHVISIEIIS